MFFLRSSKSTTEQQRGKNDNTLKFISPAKRADGSIFLKDREITVTAGKIDALWKKIDKLYTEKSKAVVLNPSLSK